MLLLIYLIFLIIDIICLRSFAKNEMFENYFMLLMLCAASVIPLINIVALLFFIGIFIYNKYDSVDDFAKKLFLVKDKKVDDNFKGKGYR